MHYDGEEEHARNTVNHHFTAKHFGQIAERVVKVARRKGKERKVVDQTDQAAVERVDFEIFVQATLALFVRPGQGQKEEQSVEDEACECKWCDQIKRERV